MNLKQNMKKLVICMLVLFLGMMPATGVLVKADYYNWNGPGWSYDTPDEARIYTMDEETQAGVAVGGNITLTYEPYYYEYGQAQYDWKSSNGNVKLQVCDDQKSVSVTGVTEGTAVVSLTYKYNDGEQEQIETKTMEIQVTKPKLKTSKIGVIVGNEGKVEILNNSTAGADHILYATDNTDNFGVYGDGSFYGYEKQTRKIFVFVDGITLTATVKCTDPTISRSEFIVKKGQSVSYKLSGVSGYTPVTYEIGNKNYATVSKSGMIKGKAYGKTTLTISADNAQTTFDLYVTKTKVYKAVMKGHSICKSKPIYSQQKRMQDGYVDCSSFVWKSYKSAGVYFGSKTYAPTAADLAQWCSKNKKLLKLSSYSGKSEKLLPGDLIFYEKRQGKNGRYKNIDHVAMYIGNDRIVHADGSSVSYSYPWYRKVAAIGRPVK